MKAPRNYWFGLIGLTAGLYAVVGIRPELMVNLGVRLPLGYWFVDIHALLAASDAFALGLNPYEYNPLDVLHVPHWYSDWWFWLHDAGLNRAHTPWLGLGIVGLFLVSALLVLRPRDFPEMLFHWLALCSPPVLLGVTRANVDLLIFSGLALAGWLLTQNRRALRLLAPPVIAFLAGLKFYPLAAAAALPLVPQNRRDNWLLLGFMAVLAVLLGLGLYDDVQRVRGLIAAMPMRLYTIGAVQIFQDRLDDPAATLVAGGLGLALLAGWWRYAPAMPAGLESRATVLFALGIATVAGCFFVGMSFNYRLVFGLLTLPLLGALRRQAPAGLVRNLTRASLAGLMALLWIDGLTCLLVKFRPESFAFATVVDCRQAVYSVTSWGWIGSMLGLWVALARPACRQLFSSGVAR